MNLPLPSYALNTEAARTASNMGNHISESGKYVGVLTRAEAVTSKENSTGIELSFKARDGREANYITLWAHAADGRELFGLKLINALLAVLRLRGITATDGLVEKMDNGQKVKVRATIFPELLNKPIGLVLQREEYTKNNGQTGYKLNLIGPFDAQTELMAGEILDRKTTPEQLTKIVQWLADNMVRQAKPSNRNPGHAPQHAGNAAPAGDSFYDDSIPF